MSKAFLLLVAGLLAGAGVYYARLVRTVAQESTPGCGVGLSTRLTAAGRVTVAGSGSGPAEPHAHGGDRGTVRLGEGDLLAGVPGEGPLTLDEVAAWLSDAGNHQELMVTLPVGLDEGAADLRGLEANPLTRAKVELGRQLYFDTRLSKDGTVSCASCHAPEHGYAMATRFGVGVEGQLGARNSPSAANRILSDAQFWDGRAASLEEQAIGPMANPAEMGLSHEAVVAFCRTNEAYRRQFERVFADATNEGGVTIENAGRAIAAFERALVSGPNAWDHHRRLKAFEDAYGDELVNLDGTEPADEELIEEYRELAAAAAVKPLAEAAARGAELFYSDRAGCTQCHAGANFSDERYHNLGVGMERLAELRDGEPIGAELQQAIDWGRFAVTQDESDRGAFKTPGLRNVAQTAPYLHDGSLATLAEVVALYVEGGHANPWLSPLVEPLDLTEREQAELVAFLEALSGEWPLVETGRLPQ